LLATHLDVGVHPTSAVPAGRIFDPAGLAGVGDPYFTEAKLERLEEGWVQGLVGHDESSWW
jgi:hypothetical protein